MNVAAVQVSPETADPEVPATAWETIASPPSLMSVQFGPRLPLARLKLSEALDPVVLFVQVTATLVTLAVAMVPEPLVMVQVCPDGLVLTVTL